MPSRLIWLALGVGAGLFVLWLQVGLISSFSAMGLGARGFQSGLSAAVEQISQGEFDAARSDFDQVQASAAKVVAATDAPQFTLLGRVPGLSTAVANSRYLSDATDAIAVSTSEMLDVFGQLSGSTDGRKIFRDGAIDIAALEALPPRVSAIDAGLSRSARDLRAVDVTGPGAGLLGHAKAQALSEVAPVQQAIDSLTGIVPLLPDMLGANGVRRYLVAIGNQAEMRASGGAPLTLVLVEFEKGRIAIPIKGQTSTQLFPPLNAPVQWWGPAPNPFFPNNPRVDPMVVANTHPNLLYSAREMAGAWEGGDYPPVDGVITLDLTAIAAALDALGPIESPAYGTVTGEQLGKILLIDAYATFGQDDATARQQANQQLLDALLTRLLSGDDIVSVARAIATTAPGRHFQVWLRNPQLERVVIASGAGGTVFDPQIGDWSAVYTQNGNQSKVDVFQQRNVLITVQLADDGSARVTQQLTMTNATPPDRPEGPPERIGYETSWAKDAFIMYVPNAAKNLSTGYPQGFAVRPFRGHQQYGRGFVDDGFGQRLVRIVGWVKPGGQAAVSVSYELPPGTFLDPAGGDLSYRLRAEPQSLFVNSTLTLRVTAPMGWTPEVERGMKATGQTLEVSAIQDRPVEIQLKFSR